MSKTQQRPRPFIAILPWAITGALIGGGVTYLAVSNGLQSAGLDEILPSFGIQSKNLTAQLASLGAAGGLVVGIIIGAVVYSLRRNHSKQSQS